MRHGPGHILWFLVLLLLPGCDESVNLDAPFQRKLVVYAVLSNTSDTQYARVYTNHDRIAGIADSADTYAADVTMTVTQGTRVWFFIDTVVNGNRLDGQPGLMRARVAHQFGMDEGKSYELVVRSPSLGEVRSSVTSLYRGTMLVENPESLETVAAVARFPVAVTLGLNGAAYILRFFVEYEYLAGGSWTTGRMEVPWEVQAGAGGEIVQLTYPSLLARGQNAPVSPRGSDGATFSGSAYRYTISRIRDQFSGSGLRFRRAVFLLKQIDFPLFAYYSTVNGFPGSGTLRIDEPDYTNIIDGFGVFATTREDEQGLALSPSLHF